MYKEFARAHKCSCKAQRCFQQNIFRTLTPPPLVLALKEKDLACAQCQLSACAVMRMKHAQSLVWATGRHNPPQIRNSYTELYRWGTLE